MRIFPLIKNPNFREEDFLSHGVRRAAQEQDAEININEDCLFQENGRNKIASLTLKEDTRGLLRAIAQLKFDPNHRTGGMITYSRIFGFSPRIKIRNEYCSVTRMAKQEPVAHELLLDFASVVSKYFKEYFLEEFKFQRQEIEQKICPDWHMRGDVPFTSGIVNKTNPLKYHKDQGNFKGCLSCMIVLKNGTEGGRLVLPEYNLKLEFQNNSLLIFNGSEILHGVTPIHLSARHGYRYSIVYYALKGIANCLPLEEELKLVRAEKMKTENKRLTLKKSDNPEEAEAIRLKVNNYKRNIKSKLGK